MRLALNEFLEELDDGQVLGHEENVRFITRAEGFQRHVVVGIDHSEVFDVHDAHYVGALHFEDRYAREAGTGYGRDGGEVEVGVVVDHKDLADADHQRLDLGFLHGQSRLEYVHLGLVKLQVACVYQIIKFIRLALKSCVKINNCIAVSASSCFSLD